MHQFLIGAAASGSGKTTVTMGLLRALHRRGLTVQPYKCGPDYIDTMFHGIAAHRQSVNLDTFMSSPAHIRSLFERYGQDADVRIVEGVMGLYDGHDSWHGSSAEVSMILQLPVVLTVSARSTAYSVAPLLHGFRHFTAPGGSQLRIAGVIFNQVASRSHYDFLQSACHDAGLPCLGYLMRNEALTIPGRHLGLTIPEQENMEHLVSMAADEVEAHVDLDRLLQI